MNFFHKAFFGCVTIAKTHSNLIFRKGFFSMLRHYWFCSFRKITKQRTLHIKPQNYRTFQS